MEQRPYPESPPTLKQVRDQFRIWRQSREKRSAIPSALWQAAVNLCHDHTISKVSSMLRLNYAALKQRVKACGLNQAAACISSPDFIELDMSPPRLTSECIVEMADQKGGTMRMYFKGEVGLDLLELGKAFWDKQP